MGKKQKYTPEYRQSSVKLASSGGRSKTPRPTLFLAATLVTCRGGVLNNDAYEYERADRFFADLGEVVARAFWGLKGR